MKKLTRVQVLERDLKSALVCLYEILDYENHPYIVGTKYKATCAKKRADKLVSKYLNQGFI